MKRHYYYFDCQEQDNFFDFLDNLVDEGNITYTKDDNEPVITIVEIELDDVEQRGFYKKIDDYNVIEDLDYVDIDDAIKEDMDDYRNGYKDVDEDDYDF